jgi:DNA-binding protein HU-beta
MARNPRTGQQVKIKKANVPTFRPGTQFREFVVRPAAAVPSQLTASEVPVAAVQSSSVQAETKAAAEAVKASQATKAAKATKKAKKEARIEKMATTTAPAKVPTKITAKKTGKEGCKASTTKN